MINFSPISFRSTKIQTKQEITPCLKRGLEKDTFEKSSISFKGKKSEFETWLSKNKFTPKIIPSVIGDAKNIIGIGNFNTVYKIPNCKDYVLRISNNSIGGAKKMDWEGAILTITQDEKLKINVGQEVARYTVGSKGKKYSVEILKRQEGEAIGNPPPNVIKGVAYRDITRKEKYGRTIHEVAKLPVSSFEKLIDNIEAVYKAGYEFDYINPNNLLVDKKGKQINIVDVEKSGCRKYPNYAKLLHSIMNASYYEVYVDGDYSSISKEKQYEAFYDNKKIVEKYFTAMRNKGKVLDIDDINTTYFCYDISFNPAFLQAIGAKTVDDVQRQLEKKKLL